LSVHDAERLIAKRGQGYRTIREVWLKTGLSRAVLERLAEADVFRSIGRDRRQALWEIEALGPAPLPLFAAAEAMAADGGPPLIDEDHVDLPPMGLGHHVAMDYARLRLSLKAHPMMFLRDAMIAQARKPIEALATTRDGARIAIAGLVTVRQRPGTAKGVIFATLEDETGVANVIIWPRAYELYRRIVLGARVLGVRGRVQRERIVIHLIADHLDDLTPHLAELVSQPARAFDGATARADEVRTNPGQDPRGTSASVLGQGRLSARGRRSAKIAYPSRDFH
jgi:error-prone DNA polymerase